MTGGIPAGLFMPKGRILAAVRAADLRAADVAPPVDLATGDAGVIGAFPRGYTERDIKAVLASPWEELGGLSPLEWLEQGSPVSVLVALIDELALS